MPACWVEAPQTPHMAEMTVFNTEVHGKQAGAMVYILTAQHDAWLGVSRQHEQLKKEIN